MKNLFTLFAAALLSISSAFADSDIKLSPEFDKCINKSGGSDPAMLECNSAEWKRQDIRLNTAYKKAMGALPPEKRKELQEVQRLWLKYSEAKCKFYYDNAEFSGTLDRYVASNCSTTERAARATELEQIANH